MPQLYEATLGAEPMTTPQTYTHEGHMLTIRQWAKATGLSKVTIYYRLKKGWPIADVLKPADATLIKPKPKPKQSVPTYSGKNATQITYKGKQQSITGWTTELNIDHRQAMQRFNRGCPAHEVLGFRWF